MARRHGCRVLWGAGIQRCLRRTPSGRRLAGPVGRKHPRAACSIQRNASRDDRATAPASTSGAPCEVCRPPEEKAARTPEACSSARHPTKPDAGCVAIPHTCTRRVGNQRDLFGCCRGRHQRQLPAIGGGMRVISRHGGVQLGWLLRTVPIRPADVERVWLRLYLRSGSSVPHGGTSHRRRTIQPLAELRLARLHEVVDVIGGEGIGVVVPHELLNAVG